MSDNKTFWKTIKPILPEKLTSTQKITLIEKEEIIVGDDNTTEVLNTVFFNIVVSNLKIELYLYSDLLANNISDHVSKCIVKYRNHLSILTIREVYDKNRRQLFSFSKIERDEILGNILKLEATKVCQDTNVLIIAKENADIFTNVLVSNLNDSIENSNFPSILKCKHNTCI